MTDARNFMVERCSWWMRFKMRLQDATDAAPGPKGLPARCDRHGIGVARSAFVTRYSGFLLMLAAVFAFMIDARPARAQDTAPRAVTATSIGVGLGMLGVSSWTASRVIERRTRYHVWLQCEARTITRADVGALLDTATTVRNQVDAAWQPDRLWLVGSAVEPEAHALATTHGARCFVMRRGQIHEV